MGKEIIEEYRQGPRSKVKRERHMLATFGIVE